MKIKTKKQLNLPQLIEWAMKNKIKGKMFLTESAYCVGFDKHGFIYFNSTNTMPLDHTFTVEVEEEVTEDTVIPKVLIVFKNESTEFIEGLSIEDIYKSSVDSIYYVKKDKTMTLIWTHDKGLVE